MKSTKYGAVAIAKANQLCNFNSKKQNCSYWGLSVATEHARFGYQANLTFCVIDKRPETRLLFSQEAAI